MPVYLDRLERLRRERSIPVVGASFKNRFFRAVSKGRGDSVWAIARDRVGFLKKHGCFTTDEAYMLIGMELGMVDEDGLVEGVSGEVSDVCVDAAEGSVDEGECRRRIFLAADQ